MISLIAELNYLHPEIYGFKRESNYASLLSSAYAESDIWRESINSLILSDFEFDKLLCDLPVKKDIRQVNKEAFSHWFTNIINQSKSQNKASQSNFKSLLSSWAF